jgi:hypothetical protein
MVEQSVLYMGKDFVLNAAPMLKVGFAVPSGL